MIKIRYAELPAGIHIRTERAGRHTVIYLLPGLTAADRRAALRRARSSARIGHGPPLPRAGLARAIAADWLRTIAGNGLAAFRAHPALFIPPMIVILSGAVAYLLLASVSIRIEPPAGPGQGGPTVVPGRTSAPAHDRTSSLDPQQPGASTPGGRSPGHRRPGKRPRGTRSPHQTKSAHPTHSGSRTPHATPSGTPTATPTSSPTPTPDPGPTPAPSPTPSKQHCLVIGPFGICLKV